MAENAVSYNEVVQIITFLVGGGGLGIFGWGMKRFINHLIKRDSQTFEIIKAAFDEQTVTMREIRDSLHEVKSNVLELRKESDNRYADLYEEVKDVKEAVVSRKGIS